MPSLLRDLGHGFRRMASAPAFTAAAVLSLALGIGANVAIFTVANAILFRPLPFPNPDQLVRITADAGAAGGRNVGMSAPELHDVRERVGVFEGVSAIWPINASFVGGDRPERVEALVTSANYFQLLGAAPQLGRAYGPQDAVGGFSEPVVISDRLWRRAFGGSRDVIGRTVLIDSDRYTIVGVMGSDFRHPGDSQHDDLDIWMACGFSAAPFDTPARRDQNFIPGLMARVKSGTSLPQAQDRLDALAAQLRATYPANYPAAVQWGLRLAGVQDELTKRVRPTLILLMAAVGLLLVVACVNIANLTLAHSSSRLREIAVRRALGATRGRLVRQLLAESLAVAGAGGTGAVVGLALAGHWIVSLIPADLPRLAEVHFGASMVAIGVALSLVAGLASGITPAIKVSGVNFSENLKDAGRGRGESRGERRFRGALVSAEIAISLVLLVGAGLLVRSLWGMLQVSPGLDPRGVGFAQIWIPVPNDASKDPYGTPAQRKAYIDEVLRQVAMLPGVESVGMALGNRAPFTGAGTAQRFTFADEPASDVRHTQFHAASPGYFATLKAPMRRGRAFTAADVPGSEPVVIVNETLARTQSPVVDPVGRGIVLGGRTVRVVGVVADIHDDGLDVPVASRIYLPLLQNPTSALALYYRTSTDPASLNAAVERAIHAVDPTLPVYGQSTMENLLADSTLRRKVVLSLMGAFAAVALLVAALGTYGVMSVAVNQRVREIGIRMALGAQRADVEWLMLRPGLAFASTGVAIGLVSAAWLSRLMTAVLFAVKPTDALTYICVSLMLIAVACIACYVPARRATKRDPLLALRSE